MLEGTGGWARTHRGRGAVLLASFVLAAGAAAWTSTPVVAGGQLVDAAGHPVGGAEVAVAATALSPAGAVRSGADGRFRIGARRWPFGAPRLWAGAPGFIPVETSGGRVVLHRWPRVTGRAADDLGAALAGAVVTLSRAPATVGTAMTDLDGRFDLALERLDGRAMVTVTMDQHDTASQAVTLATDQVATVEATLPRQLATVHLESDPAGQAPLVDGQPAPGCQATPCDVTVLAGPHELSLVNDLYLPWSQVVELDRGATVSLSAVLERKTGTLTLTPPGPGELAVDGQWVGGGAWSGSVPTGAHTVSFRSASTWPAIARADVSWNGTTAVRLSPVPVVPGDAAGFVSQLRAYLDAQGGGSYGVYLENLGSGATIGVGDGDRLEAASVIKVPEALYLLHQVDAGQVSLDDQVDLHPEDFMGGTGSLYGTAHPGDRYSYQQLLALLIQQSDNTAWKTLDRVLGAGSVDAYAASLGAGDCHQWDDACSARSAGHLMAQLARGRLLSSASTQRLLSLLETTIFNDRINYYLAGVAVAHKVGMDAGVANDCGVVFLPGNPFAVCVLTATGDPDAGAQVIRDVARAAARYYAG